MPFVQSTLASGIAALVPTPSEGPAIAGLTSAWATYFAGASVAGVPIAAFAAATASFQGALSGMSAPNAGTVKIAAAVQAFWATLAPLGPTLWILAPNVVVPPLVPPPGLGGLAALLQGAFTANNATGVTLAQAADRIAAAMHASNAGGTAVVQPPPPVPPVPTPIL
jgi:hypothetical protein